MTVVVQLGLSLTNSPMYCKSSFFAFICWQLVFLPFLFITITSEAISASWWLGRVGFCKRGNGWVCGVTADRHKGWFQHGHGCCRWTPYQCDWHDNVYKDGRNSANGSWRVPVAAEWMGFSFPFVITVWCRHMAPDSLIRRKSVSYSLSRE